MRAHCVEIGGKRVHYTTEPTKTYQWGLTVFQADGISSTEQWFNSQGALSHYAEAVLEPHVAYGATRLIRSNHQERD